MADPLTESQKQLEARGVPLTRAGELSQGLGSLASNPTGLAIPLLLEKIYGSVRGEDGVYPTSVLEGLLGPSKELQGLGDLANTGEISGVDSDLIGIDFADLPGTGVGVPDIKNDTGLSSKPYPAHLSDEKAREQAKRMFLANRSSPSNYIAPDREASSPEEIQALINNSSKTPANAGSEGGANDGTIVQSIITKKRAEAGLAEEARLFDDIGVDKEDTVMENALIGSMNPYLEAINKKIPTAESREDLIKKYKKEFSEATGIEIDGKVDKSQALMAMGLSLMQNRAGSGFNVGKILNAVGQAGDKAMPYLREATKEAKAAKVAAGKYALDKISSGESAAAAIAASEKAFQKERYLKLLDLEAGIEEEKIKAGGKVAEVKNVKVDKVINGLEVQRGRGVTGAVFVFPEDALRDSSGALKSVNGALTTVDTMLDLASQIASEKSPTFSLLSETVNTALVGAGLVDAEVVFGDSKVGRNQQIKILQDSILTQFKRMLTQETGNGISKSDVDNIKEMLGDFDLLGNPEESLLRLQEIKTLFTGKRTAVRGVLDELQSPDNYVTASEYEKNMELYPSLIAGSMQYSINKSENSSVIDVKDE